MVRLLRIVSGLQTTYSLRVSTNAVFWHDPRIRPLISPLVGQLGISLVSSTVSGRTVSSELQLLSHAFTGIVECTEDDSLLKDMNMKVLMHTRSEDVRVRLAAVQSAAIIWDSQGRKLRGVYKIVSNLLTHH